MSSRSDPLTAPRKVEHIPTCSQLEKRPCPASHSLHSEEPSEHWWSGWPGAYCMKCGDGDKDEICIGSGCKCHCHDEFWRKYQEGPKMTPTEMNEQVALRIGYRYKEAHTAIISARCGSPFNVLQSQVPESWMTPGNVKVNKLPPWSTDDGLAFKELWPRIIEVDPEAAIEIYQHIKKPCVSLRINDPSEWKMIWGNTWAEAICLAFIALMPLEEPK